MAITLTFEGGCWHAWSSDQRLHIRIRPRRSIDGEATVVDVRMEPMPMIRLEVERMERHVRVEEWVWNDMDGADTLMLDRILALIRRHFQVECAVNARSAQWRQRLLKRLEEDSMLDGQEASPESQRDSG